jgi:hypothetical protein
MAAESDRATEIGRIEKMGFGVAFVHCHRTPCSFYAFVIGVTAL